MTIQQAVHEILNQLEGSIVQLTDGQYCQGVDTLSGASIGQHVRHVVEMFVCLEHGYCTGIVNYEKRKREIVIETSSEKAIEIIHHINTHLCPNNKELILEAGFDENSNELISFPTNYFREIAYNLEHAIHHMALIKIGIREVSDIQLSDGYGVASSTIKYRSSISSK